MTFLIPSRAARPGDDPIFALNAEARAREQAGEAIVNATVGALLDDEGQLVVLGAFAETLRQVPVDVAAGYAPISGPPAFLSAVIRDLLGDRPEAAWAVATATPGGTGAIRMALGSLLEPGQAALTTSLFWGPYRTIADDADRRIETFAMFDARGGLDVGAFEREVRAQIQRQGRVLALLNAPCHNPTGYSLDDGEWDDIIGVLRVLAREAGHAPVTLAIDVAYARYGAADLGRCIDRVLPLVGDALVLFMWSASKSFTAYGQRVGALVALTPDAEQRRRLENAFGFACRGTWSNCNAGGMAAITRLLTEPDLAARVERERAAKKALLDRRVARWNALAAPAKLRYPRYTGGFFTTVFCDDAPAAAARLRAEGVFVVPQASALRVALCSVAERDVPRLVDALARAVR